VDERQAAGTPNHACVVKQVLVEQAWCVFEALRLEQAQSVPGVVESRGTYFDPVRGLLLMALERLDGSLLDLIQSGYPVTEAFIADVARQTLIILQHFHDLHLVHLDLKPANLLYKQGATGPIFKLGDLGCVQDERNGECDALGEYTYISPEVLLEQPRTTKSDLWNLGVMLLHAADGVPPMNGWDDALRSR